MALAAVALFAVALAAVALFAVALAAVALIAVALVACSTTAEPTPTSTSVPEAAPADVRVVVAASDLAVGPNRFTFGILDSASSPIRVPEATTTFVYLDSTPQQVSANAKARFVRWPSGRAGVYVASVSFDQAGRWGLVVEFAGEDGTAQEGRAGFVVEQESSSPGIGRPAPLSKNKTARDVSDLEEITTALVPDPDLYRVTVLEAVSSGKPTVVTFATPAFCQTATCGPQLTVLSSLEEKHSGEANFIHIEVYDNPDEIEGDLSRGRLSPLLGEWGLRSEPFTFLLDGDGLVAAKFEGFVTEDELEAALAEVLGS